MADLHAPYRGVGAEQGDRAAGTVADVLIEGPKDRVEVDRAAYLKPRGVEAAPVGGQLPERPDGVAAGDQRADVHASPQAARQDFGEPSSQTGNRPRYSSQRLRGSMTAPPPVAMTRRSWGSGSAGPSDRTASRS